MTDLENPLTSLSRSMAFDSRDWAADRRDAWRYGIVCGWSDESLEGFVDRGFWDADESQRLRRLHQSFAAQTTAERLTDPRPSDMAELARLVAAELRKRGIWANESPAHNVMQGLCVPRVYRRAGGDSLRWGTYLLIEDAFDNLGPTAIADEIQRQEAQRAQEWAGDK